jgi:hypothetical protein
MDDPTKKPAEIVREIGPNNAGDLYIWLSRHFPPQSDPPMQGFVGPRARAAMLRESVLRALQAQGTKEAVATIRKLADELPEQDWLKYHGIAAERNRLEMTWVGIPPKDLFKLAKTKEARLVDSGKQLLDVIIESLQRLQTTLHGETPAVADLWNTRPTVTPKEENGLSDYVARHLRQDLQRERGLIANREVEISRRGRTDIHVDALSRDETSGDYHLISAIIEVKGCWNKGLKQDMEKQLKDRYLRDNRCPYGMYLVGWFRCEEWDADDPRHGKTPKWDLNKASKVFAAQAKELSDEDTVIRSFVLNAAYK